MKRISLGLYSVRVKQEYSRTYELIDSFGDDWDVLDFLQDVLGALKTKATNDPANRKVMEVAKQNFSGRKVRGIIESGEYGTETVLRDVTDWKIAYRRKTHDAEMLPFFFHFDLPEGRDKGLLLLQRTGIFGIRRVLSEWLKDQFGKRFNRFRLSINPMIPEDALKKYVGSDAELVEIRFIRHTLSSDITNSLTHGSQARGSMELVIKIRQAGRFPLGDRIREYVRRRRGLQNLIEFEETKFRYENVKIKVRLGGKDKIVDLGNPHRLRAAFDVTEDIDFSDSGHPTFASMSTAADEILEEVSAELYGRG